MFDAMAFKQHFPLFSQPENQRLVYLDNAATTQKPRCVIDAISHFYLHDNANAHRASHRLARQATMMVEQTRQQAAQFFGAESSDCMVFCAGATAALNLLASSLCQQLQAGDEIVLSRAEHHANLVPWQLAAERHGLHLRFVPDHNGIPQLDRLHEVLSPRTRIVSLAAASNALGMINDIAAVAARLDRDRVRLVVDGSQLVAHQPLTLAEYPCDFFVFSAHKMYGPTGVGLLYGRAPLLQQLPPWQGGGEMIHQVSTQHSSFADAPMRFEAGTAPLAAIAGLSALLGFLDQQDRAAMQQHETALTGYLHQQLAAIPELRLLSRADNNVGIAAFVAADGQAFAAADMAAWLDQHDIAVRAGHHCAQPLMQASGEAATVRVSLAAYNSHGDIDRLVTAIRGFFQQLPAGRQLPDDDLSGLSIDELRRQTGQQRFRLLMQWGDALAAKPAIRVEQNRLQGCESAVWLHHALDDGRHRFYIDSDSRLIRGFAVLLLLLVDKRSSADIARLDLDRLLDELQLARQLSASRRNGFYTLLAAIRQHLA